MPSPTPALSPASAVDAPNDDPSTPTFSQTAWRRTAEIRRAIDVHPFLTGLADGSLARETFVEYMRQDALYLVDYGRALAGCAQRAVDAEDVIFWSGSAEGAVREERSLHATHIDGLAVASRSPTTTAYTSYLLAVSARGSYAELVAAVLPCFWIYDDVGRRLRASVDDLAHHPYGDWISTYGDPAFTAATLTARQVADRVAHCADAGTVERMHAAFAQASRYEWMFWDAAYRHETWPV